MGFCSTASAFPGASVSPVARHYDNANALIMQPVDKTVGPLASSQIDLNEGRGGDIVGDQLLDLGRRRGRPDHLRPNGPKKQLQQLLRRDTGTVVVASSWTLRQC